VVALTPFVLSAAAVADTFDMLFVPIVPGSKHEVCGTLAEDMRKYGGFARNLKGLDPEFFEKKWQHVRPTLITAVLRAKISAATGFIAGPTTVFGFESWQQALRI